MNLTFDTALCIGGPCPDKHKCARWVVYDQMRETIENNPHRQAVTITTPPWTHHDGCFLFMSTNLDEHENQ